jgi:uncharacterized protein with HEPN domain
MLDATREALGYAVDKSREDLDRDTMLFRALVKCLEIIGEAASRVSAQARGHATGIPWERISGMRNRLIHAYFDINKELVWKTVVEDLPNLERELRAILPADLQGD